MKKVGLGVVLLGTCSLLQAGTMGPVSTRSYVPYITGEASYTGMSTGDLVLNNVSSTGTNQGWGGRLGVGIAYPSPMDKLDFTAEIGGGYYGSKERSQYIGSTLSSRDKIAIDGYDILVGALYRATYVDIFGQVGFMVQNARLSAYQNLTFIPDYFESGAVTDKGSETQALPEVKVGAIYNYTPNWGITVAYMGVFGGHPSFNANVTALPTSRNQLSEFIGPTLNSVMFGLRYSIV